MHGDGRLRTPTTHQNPIISTRRSTSLSVSKRGHSSIQPEPLDEDILDIISLDRVQVLVQRTLGDNDDGLSLSNESVL